MIFSLDTASALGSLALTERGEVVEQVLLRQPEGFGQVLFSEVERLLFRHNVRPADLQALAVANGPGTFTGVRIGVAAAKGMAEALSIPLFSVSNLQALAALGSAPLRAVFLDARREQVYAGLYDAALRSLEPEIVTTLEAWKKSLPIAGVQLLGIEAAPDGLAGAVGRVAWELLKSGNAGDPEIATANYVRRSDAELFWEDTRLTPHS